jgi:hypothetical protein
VDTLRLKIIEITKENNIMKNKKYAITLEEFSTLPNKARQDILDILKAFKECPVIYENGRYSFVSSLKSEYAKDHKVIGIAYQDDFYTDEQRIENYIEVFHEYPSGYIGKRDYKMLRELKDKSLA